MLKQSACPQDIELRRLASGELPAAQMEPLTEHLERCESCLAKVQTFAPADTLAKSLPLARKTSHALHDTGEVSGLIGKLKSLSPSPAADILCVCGKCGKKLKVKSNLIGKKVKCPGCGQAVAVSAPALGAPFAEERTLAPAVPPADGATLPPETQSPHSRSMHSTPSDATAGLEGSSREAQDEAWDFLAPPQAPDEIGRLGTYRILKVLGRGGMGVVFRAEDPNLKRIVALKAMLPTLAASPSAKKRFLREAQTAASIKHDHIVTIHQVGEDRGAPFLAMEFLHGEPLDVRLKREGMLTIPEVLRIGRECAEGLAAAHDAGLIHRDIKPGNVWLEKKDEGRRMKDEKKRSVSSSSRVKILDFGLARSTDDTTGLTQSGAIIGTPAYMAPEQANGGAVDHRCDLFSLGCMLYVMTTGQLPFAGKDTMSILMAVAMSDPKPPIELNPKTPQELSDLILRLLAKNPADRPADAAEVAAELETLSSAVPTSSTTTAIKASGEHKLPDSSTLGWAASPGARAENQETYAPRSPRSRGILIACGLALIALVAAGVVFFLPAGNGTIRVEINDPDIEVAVGAKGVTIKGTEKQGDIVVAAGEHSLKVKRDNLEFETDKIVLKKGEIVTVKVEWLKDKLQVAQGSKVIGARDIPKVDVATRPVVPGSYALHFADPSRVDLPELPFGPAGTIEVQVAAVAEWKSGRILEFAKVIDIWFVDGYNRFYFLWQPTKSQSDAPSPPAKRPKSIHLACVWSGDTMRFYSNGQLVDTKPFAAGNWKANAAGVLGKSFTGAIGEVRVSKVARYDKDFTPAKRHAADADTLALYHCDEGPGEVLVDSSGNGHHGKIVGAKWVKTDGTTITPPSTSGAPAGVALEFDGKTTHVNVPTLNLNASGPMTVEARVRFSKSTGDNDTIASGYSPTTAILLCRMNGINPVFLARKDLESKFVGLDGNLDNDVWVHVAGVWDRKVARLFVDGKPQPNVIEKQLTLAMTASQGQHLILGADRVTPLQPLGGFFHGQMAEVRISKVARYDKEFAPAPRFEKDTNTIALYKFDEGQGDKLTDSSGNGHHGKIVGAKWVKAGGTPIAPPPSGNLALRFDGQQRVDIPNLKLPTDSPYTMEGYFHPDADKVGGVDNYAMGIPTQSHLSYTKNADWRWAAPKSGDTKAGIPGIAARPRPHHIACVYDGKQRRVFVDGQQVGKTTSATEVATNRTFVLGGSYFGTIDEVRVSKVARYSANFTPSARFEPDADTLALYHCDEGQGDKLVDSSGNGHHGTIVGVKWVKVGAPIPAAELVFDTRGRVEVPSLLHDKKEPLTIEVAFTSQGSRGIDHFAGFEKGLRLRSYSRDRIQARFGAEPHSNLHSLPMQLFVSGRQEAALVYTGKEILGFGNGKFLGRIDAKDYDPAEVKGLFMIGESFGGRMHQVRVSKSARYANDYAPGQAFLADKDTLALYRFDEGEGDAIKDHSGNGHHGKIVGAKWVKAEETKIAPPPTVTHADRLAFLEWFAQEMAINKSVRIEQDGTVFPLKGKTPAGPFLIRGVNLRHSKEGLALADEDMARIAAISEIQELNLSHRTISEAGMAHLARMTELRKLYLGDSTIPIESAKVVRGLPKLESLHFPKATDTWIEALAGMPSLRFVQFYRQSVSDSAFARFKDFPGLAAVQFKECKVTEARLHLLKEVKSLRLLILEKKGGSGNDADAYKRLAQALPECEIRDSRGKDATIYNKGKADGLKLEPDEPNEDMSVYLDELAEKSFFALGGEFLKSGTAAFAKNWANSFAMTGDPPAHALIIHPVPKREGHVTYDLGGKYATFQTTARCRNGRVAPLYVEIFGDGRSLAKTENLAKTAGAGVELKVDIRGVKEMKIVIDTEEKTTYGHVLLLEPRLTPITASPASTMLPPVKLKELLVAPHYEHAAASKK